MTATKGAKHKLQQFCQEPGGQNKFFGYLLDQVVVLVLEESLTGLVFHPVQHPVCELVAFPGLVQFHIPVQSAYPFLHNQRVGIREPGNRIYLGIVV